MSNWIAGNMHACVGNYCCTIMDAAAFELWAWANDDDQQEKIKYQSPSDPTISVYV